MIVPVAEYPFNGPHRSLRKIENRPGVFAVLCEERGRYFLIDVDYSDNVKKAISNHERRNCWEKYRRGLIRYAVLYENVFPSESKKDIENKIRKKYTNIPCGDSEL